MIGTTNGQTTKANIAAIPRSTLLYASAGFVGAVGITAIELATKINATGQRPVQPVIQKSGTVAAPTADVAFPR